MKIKKITALILSLGILSHMLSAAVYAEEVREINSEKIILLTMLDIIDPHDEEALFDAYVSRADFALYAGKIIGIDEKNGCSKRFYTDLPSDHWAVNTINTLTDMGILKGSGGKFYPGDEISYTEALAMLLNAVGLGEMAEKEGGYPRGYMNLAVKYDINTKTADAERMTFGEVCSLIYDVLFVPVPEITISDGTKYGYSINKDVNVLGAYFDTYRVKGILTGALGISVNAEPACGINEVRIDGECYNSSFEDAADYLGMKVRAYYKETDDENEVFYIAPADSGNYLKIDIREFDGYNEKTHELYYTKKGTGSERRGNIAVNATVVKNGKNVSSDIKGAFENLNEGTITVAKSGAGDYDMVIIKDYEDIVVSSYNSADGIIYDKNIRGRKIELDGINCLRVYDKDKNPKSTDDIMKNMTLSVCRSDNYCEILISENTVSGKIISAEHGSDEIIVSLEDGSYPVAPGFYEKNEAYFKSGRNVKLYINAFGTCAWAEFFGNEGFLCGYVIKTYITEDEELFGIKLLTQSGDIENLYLADKAAVNKKLCRSPQEAADNIKSRNGKSSEQVIVYKTNEDGRIIALETAAPYGSDAADAGLRVDKPLYTGYYYSGTKMMGESVLIGEGAVCFKVPEVVTSYTTNEDYSVINPSSLSDKVNYTAESYKTDEDTLCADIMLIKSNASSGSWFHKMVVVGKVYEIYNEKEGEVEQVADMWVDGNKTTYRAARKTSFDAMPQFFDNSVKNKLETGDVLRIFLNTDGEITNADLFYSAKTSKPNYAMNAYNDWSWEIYFGYGFITDIKNGAARFEYNEDGESRTGIAKTENVPVIVYDSSVGKINTGSAADLDEAMNEHKLVYFGQNFGTTQSIYVIK